MRDAMGSGAEDTFRLRGRVSSGLQRPNPAQKHVEARPLRIKFLVQQNQTDAELPTLVHQVSGFASSQSRQVIGNEKDS